MALFFYQNLDRPEVVKLGGGDPRTKKRSWERDGMKRDFLEALGLEKETVDKIMAENGTDLEREKAKTTAARADLADAQGKLSASKTGRRPRSGSPKGCSSPTGGAWRTGTGPQRPTTP